MSDNTQLVDPPGSSNADIIRTIDRSTAKTQVVQLDIGGESAESLVTSGNPLPVSGTFWQATQPVSGTFWQATQPVSGTVNATVSGTVGISGTVPVSGTFWQATQPVSGTFWQATQPVSGTVTVAQATAANLNATVTGSVAVSNFPASQAVTGTFWQATQPISASSLPLPSGASVAVADASTFTRGTTVETTDGGVAETSGPSLSSGKAAALSLNLSGGLRVDGSGVTQPVSGTFWQSTQPVSVAATLAVKPDNSVWTLTGTSANVDVTNSVAVTGTFWQATQPVSGTFWQATQPVSGTVTANQGTAAAASSAWPVTLVPQTGNGWSKWSTPKNNSNTPLTATVVAVKSSAAGELGGYIVFNNNATQSYLQIFDVATAGAVTLGSTAPDMVVPIPANSGANLEITVGVAFANGIQIAATTTDSGNTAPGAGLTVTIFYK